MILGGDGDDTLNGGAGDDVILGGPGNDDINGAPGDDVVIQSLAATAARSAGVRGASWLKAHARVVERQDRPQHRRQKDQAPPRQAEQARAHRRLVLANQQRRAPAHAGALNGATDRRFLASPAAAIADAAIEIAAHGRPPRGHRQHERIRVT